MLITMYCGKRTESLFVAAIESIPESITHLVVGYRTHIFAEWVKRTYVGTRIHYKHLLE